jgi:hypothetical protein
MRELQPDSSTPGQAGDLLARDFQQTAVGRMGDRLLLHRGINDHVREFHLLDRTHRDGGFDRGLEQLLHAGFTQHAPQAPDLRGVARHTRLVVGQPAEELP